MKKLFFITIMFFVVAGYTQQTNKVITDAQSGKDILIGQCDRQALTNPAFADAYNEGYNSYVPDQEVINKLKKEKKNVQVVVVMGSWCDDSKTQVPHFYKIIDEAGIKDSDIRLISVDRQKKGGDVDVSSYDIQRVPTFIFYKHGREMGRIVESPTTSALEKDLLLIFSHGS
ncbi:MAG: thioredoxin family protein [Bacteroidales bacterium]|nr:thioredoxin family protein [Bacteroidales bacterium]